jgi:glycosyltransferase involved in cell wall biosynthesis
MMTRELAVSHDTPNIQNSRVRVLFAILEFSDQMLGGARSLSLILRQLKQIDPYIVCFRQGEFYNVIRSLGMDVKNPLDIRENLFERFRTRSFRDRWKLFSQIARANWYIYRTIRSQRIPVVHCNSIFDFLFSFIGTKLAGAKLLFNVRGAHPQLKMRWHWQVALLLSSAVVVLSREMKEYYLTRTWKVNRSFVKNKLTAIYSAVPFEELKPSQSVLPRDHRQKLGLPEGAFIVNYVASIRPLKMQLEFLKKVIAPVVKENSRFFFCFLGGPVSGDSTSLEYWKECLAEKERLDLEHHVLFAGHQENIYPWYFASDITALAFREEGLPRSMIESISCGRPVIATDFNSAREILEQYDCGLVYSQGDWNGFLSGLIRLSREDQLREEMGRKGSKAAQELFDLHAIVNQYEQIYFRLTGHDD